MKRIGLFAAAAVFAAIFTVSSFAQPGAAGTGMKIAVIDSRAFALEKEGISKYVNAVKQINTEFAPKYKELDDLGARIQKIADELKAMTSNTAVPIKQDVAQAKQDEGERLQREYSFKEKELQDAIGRRSQSVLGPITDDILKAIQEYSTSKGYTVVFDLSKVDGMLAMDPKAEITKEFIAYYNTRPASAATAAKPN